VSAAVYFVNGFHVRDDVEDFGAVFADASEFMRRRPGFLGHRLIRSSGDAYVNIAEWRDLGSLLSAIRSDGFAEHARTLRAAAVSNPQPCRVVFETVANPAPASAEASSSVPESAPVSGSAPVPASAGEPVGVMA
jgi:heme-degrading monooxygenase HmoA